MSHDEERSPGVTASGVRSKANFGVGLASPSLAVSDRGGPAIDIRLLGGTRLERFLATACANRDHDENERRLFGHPKSALRHPCYANGRVWIVVVGLLGFFILVASPFWVARYRARRETTRLRRLRGRELVAELRSLIRFERWERFAAAARILRRDACTDDELLDDLRELVVEAKASTPDVRGPAGNEYRFYDGGFATILEALEERTGRTR
jgi:hypothetical protein